MNPENVGEQIPLRHSSLWRKPLHYQKPQKQLPQCHLQLNEAGMMGYSWTTKKCSLPQNSTIQKRSIRPSSSSKKCQQEDKPTQAELLPNQEIQTKSSKLAETMFIQKSQNSTQARENYLTLATYPAVGRSPFVMNDYHSRLVNPGYVRNVKGKHFAH